MPYTVKEINELDVGGLWPARKIRCTVMNDKFAHPEQKIEVGDIFEVLYTDRKNWETIQPSGFVLSRLKNDVVVIPGLDAEFEIIQEWDADKLKYTKMSGDDIVTPVGGANYD